jgi:hypothetical protein
MKATTMILIKFYKKVGHLICSKVKLDTFAERFIRSLQKVHSPKCFKIWFLYKLYFSNKVNLP